MTLPNITSNLSPFQSAVVVPVPAAPADQDAQQRVLQGLENLEALTTLIESEENYAIEPLDYEVPAGFKLSIVIPVFNEEATIRKLLARVGAIPLPKEVVIVDDCSTDSTRDILAEIEGSQGVTVIYKMQNEGKGAALRTGFEAAKGEVVIVQDADLEYDPRDIPRVVRPLIFEEADVVYGSRFLARRPEGSSWVHRLGNGLLTFCSNLTTGLKLTDMETCYKAFRRPVLRGVEIKQNRFGFEPEITAKVARAGCRVLEVPIGYAPRGFDEGKKIGVKDLINAFWCIARYSLAD